MNKPTHWLSLLIVAFLAVSCTTNDVELPKDEEVDPTTLYEITDAAFGDYLIYNSGLATSNANALPYGVAFKKDGRYFISKDIAKTATMVYLVKDATRIANLVAAGVPTAEVKIVNVDGIQLFTGAKEVRLTSNNVIGKLDVSMLTLLETLEMNANYVNELIVPASIKRLRYNASTVEPAPEDRFLTSINLAACSQLNHLSLTNHHLTTAGLVLPSSYAELKEIDLTGNTDTPFILPSDLYAQLTIRNGVIEDTSGAYDGPMPNDNYYEISDVAFGEYLEFLANKDKNTGADVNDRLPEGTALKYTNGKLYINKSVAATVTNLNISKAAAFITKLTNASVPSASVKIADADGLQFFTAVKTLVATSNAFTEPLKLTNLTELTSLTVRTAGLSTLDISTNIKLTFLDIQGSTSVSLGKLQAADLSKNTALVTVNLSANEIDPANFVLPSSYPSLKTLNMGTNKVGGVTVTYTVPAALYDQLGSATGDRAGLVRGQ